MKVIARVEKLLLDAIYLPLLVPALLRPYRKWLLIPLALGIVVAVVMIWLKLRPPAGLESRLETPEANLTQVLFTPNGKLLVAGTASGRVLLWDAKTRYPLPLGQQSSQQITSLAATADQFLIAGTISQRLLVWDMRRKSFKEIPPQAAPITCLAIHPKRAELVIGLSEGTLQFLNTATGVFTSVKSGHEGSVRCLAYAPDGRTLVSGGSDSKLIVRDAATRAVRKTLTEHHAEISCLSFADDGKMLVSADWSGKIMLWTMPVASLLREIQYTDGVSCAALLGEQLVTGSWDGKLQFRSIASARLNAEYDSGRVIHDLAVAPDGRQVLTVSPAREIQFWRVPK